MRWQGSVFSYRSRLRLKVKTAAGKWVHRATGLDDTPENWEKAEKLLTEVRNKMNAIADATDGAGGPITVRRWGERWMRDRRNRVADPQSDEGRLKYHVYPVIGDMPLDAVRPRHLVELVEKVRVGHAPRTVRNVYSVVKALFRDARIADIFTGQDPCILTHRQLGKVHDRTFGWRASAVFTREELTLLITSERVPDDRRVQYALLGLGMLRLGEMAGLRWEHIQPAEPLGRLAVWTSYSTGLTKAQVERWMPVHPTLAAMLAVWKLSGWAQAFGRAPASTDLVLPVTPEPPRKGRIRPVGAMRDRHYVWKRQRNDLVALGLRHRRVHDLRRTGISLARSDGADRSILNWGTHAPPTDVMNLYTSIEWSALCREVLKLRVARTNSGTKFGTSTPVRGGEEGS